jgi:hypothetical protein
MTEQESSLGQDMVFMPSTLPVLSSIDIDSIMAHFDDDVYDKTASSHLRHIVEVVCGQAGFGQLLAASVKDWLNGGVETAWLGFVDQLFASIYGLPRVYSEKTSFDTDAALLTVDEANEALVKESWYKERFVDMMRAMNDGGTVKGFKEAVRSVTFDDCEMYETWRYEKRDETVGRMQYLLRNEVVIVPDNKDITPQQKDLLLRVLDRIKPADVIVTIDTNGLASYKEDDLRDISASSSYFEIVKTLTNAVDSSKLPPPEYLFDEIAYGYDANFNLNLGDQAEVRKNIENRTQEYSEYYVYDKSNNTQIKNISYQSEYESTTKDETSFSEKTSSIQWSDWKQFDRIDSPDNFPGGKYGKTPLSAPALNKDGSSYTFQYDSQNEYELEQSKSIIASGGQVSGHQYRMKSFSSSSDITYLPEMSLMSVNNSDGTLSMMPEKSK